MRHRHEPSVAGVSASLDLDRWLRVPRRSRSRSRSCDGRNECGPSYVDVRKRFSVAVICLPPGRILYGGVLRAAAGL